MKEHPAIQFLEVLYPPKSTPGYINFRFITPEGEVRKHAFITPREIRKKLPPLLKKHRDCNVSYQVAVSDGEGGKAHIQFIPAIIFDVDFRGDFTYKDWKKLPLLPAPLKVSILVNSGGGIHGYFLLKEPLTSEDIPKVEEIQKRLAPLLKADPSATDASHLLRLPGTLNLKYKPPRMAKIIRLKPELRYELSDFECLPSLEVSGGTGGDLRNPPGWEKQIIENGVAEGERNSTLTRLAGRYVAKKLSREEVLPILLDTNSRFNPPLDEREVGGILDSVIKTHQRNDPNGATTTESEPISELIKKIGRGKGCLYPAQDFKQGLLWYGVFADGQVLLVNSDKKILRLDELPPDLMVNNQGFNVSRFTGEGVSRFLSGDTVNGYDLLMHLRDFFRRHLIIRDDRIFSLLATWAVATYVYQIFQVFPYLSLRSPTKTCGKGRVLDLLRCVCFNATDRQTNPSEAVIYRHPIKNGGTLLLDEIENLHSQQDNKYGQIVATLNSGFEKGGSVTRFEKRGNKWVDISYPTYCPRVLTGIKRLADTLQSRAITVFMERKLRGEHIDRLRQMKEFEARQPERNELYIWSLNHARLIEGVYEEAYRHPGLEPLEDRERDLWESLITVASICDNEREKDGVSVSEELIGLAQALSLVQADLDSGNVPQVLKMLEEALGIEQQTFITPGDLFKQFKDDPYFEWLKSTKALAHQLGPLGLVSSNHRIVETGKIKRAYKITRERVDDLKARYGVKGGE